ncbi:glycosyltransferase family A protein [Flavobacterium sp. UMI-01]|uniref:glycosyltransferase family 2 protein n=1 Tax=Flavobacterium sp. UMI-01 TaxID=1441053 RepID=UPI001C7D4902|nr:glycosyltransferase family A protein [Flavobacterium sp. UMI-01]GIZ10486.1 glycosyl transferase [Flavobacterium sp. UMI-01]
MTFFSVIITLYNKENFITNTLSSVLNQSFTNFEVIIINDGSTDSSEEKVIEFKDSRISYFYTENRGVSHARNLGIKKAKSNYIAFIDGDDYWYPNFLLEMHRTIELFPEQNIFSAAIEIEVFNKTFPAKYSLKKTRDHEVVNYFNASLNKSIIWTSCAVFHKNVFENVGVFDPNIKISEDTDLWIRLGLVYPIVFNWKILAKYICNPSSTSRNWNYIMEESTFCKYKEEEKTNKPLKKFLDLNRFTMSIKCKLNSDLTNYKAYYKKIDFKNLSPKRIILLHLPKTILKLLISINKYQVKLGLSNSIFK